MTRESALSRVARDYGIVVVLVLLCVYFAFVTYTDQHPTGSAAGEQLARQIPSGSNVVIIAGTTPEDHQFSSAVAAGLRGGSIPADVLGEPVDAKKALDGLEASGAKVDVIACTEATSRWGVLDSLRARGRSLSSARVLSPSPVRGSNFLKTENLVNVANQIAVIAIIAIGMTLVIITGGVDLSVGSLIALSAVVTTLLIRDRFGAERAGGFGMVAASLVGILCCGAIGLLSGVMVAVVRIPAFIATLGMMLVASGLAFIFAKGQSIYQVPDSFIWLGRGADLGPPNAVLLMVLLYAGAHIFMTRARAGRYVYAVGANQEAARLSGVPVRRILLIVYTLSGLLAGLGGVVMASQLKSGVPTYGQMYELYVIAAVVVGGASLSGGEGRALGTLIGAFIIAVIQNGMNLLGVESYTQKVVLGLVILAAVILDTLRTRGSFRLLGIRRGSTGTAERNDIRSN